jgi:hypothetical protein
MPDETQQQDQTQVATNTNSDGQGSGQADDQARGDQNTDTTLMDDKGQADDTGKAQGAPEKYEFVAPEGQEFDAEFIKAYEATARELDLPQDKAQKIIDKISPVLQERQIAQLNAIRAEWAESSRTDKEFGGEKIEENLAVAKKALDQFGSPELKDLMNKSGLGNHPEMIRFFYRAGKSISPDTFVGGTKEGKTEPMDFNTLADKLYSK